MSKSVRLKDHLVAEVERLANEERRSLAQMVELLLEQALKIESSGAVEGPKAANPTRPPRTDAAPDDHFKPDFKK